MQTNSPEAGPTLRRPDSPEAGPPEREAGPPERHCIRCRRYRIRGHSRKGISQTVSSPTHFVSERRERDSNPRYSCLYTTFPRWRIRPLCHLSALQPSVRLHPPPFGRIKLSPRQFYPLGQSSMRIVIPQNPLGFHVCSLKIVEIDTCGQKTRLWLPTHSYCAGGGCVPQLVGGSQKAR